MGSGWSWLRANDAAAADHAQAARDGGARLRGAWPPRSDYVLDEFTYPLDWGWIDVDEVVSVLSAAGPPACNHHRTAGTGEADRRR